MEFTVALSIFAVGKLEYL